MKLGKGITLRGNIYWLRYTPKGSKRQCITLQTSDPVEAVARARETRASPLMAPQSGLATEIERFLDTKRKLNVFSKTTARVHGAALREFSGYVGELNVNQVREGHAQAHYKALQARVAETTAQIHMRAIRAFFSWCVQERLCLTSPCAGLKLATIDKPARDRFCTKEEREKLIKKAPTDDLRFILYCGFHLGMRKGEIVEARTGWFNLAGDGACHIENTDTFRIKDRDARFIPISPPLRKFLEGYLQGKERDQFAFLPKVKHGKGSYRYDFHRPFNDYLAAKKMDWVTAHTMRHTFASLLVQSGVSIFKVARWLGDGVEVVEKHYAHLAPQDGDIDRML